MQESKTPVFRYLNLTVFSDGSTSRAPEDPPPVPPSPSPVTGDGDQLLTMDVSLNPRHGTLARLFLPYPPPSKLPVLVYFHGGGFMSMSTTLPLYHSFLSGLARRAIVLIVSVDYRLAPEDRLPCAYEDGVDALQWLCEQAKKGQCGEPWLARHADFSKIFLGGDSSGANIAYNVALRTARIRLGLGSGSGQYICVRGMMLIHPMFTGKTMTESERRYRRRFNYLAKVWEWCLPAGSNRDHPFANPLGAAPSSSSPEWLSSCQDQVDSSSLSSSSSSDASSSLSPSSLSAAASSSSSSDPSSSSSLSSSTSRSSSSCSPCSSSDNPVESPLPCLSSSSSSLWRCLPAALVAVASEDLMTDRAVAFFHALRKAGTQAELFVSQNEDHAFHLYCPASPTIAPLLNQLSSFLNPSLCPRNLSPKL